MVTSPRAGMLYRVQLIAGAVLLFFAMLGAPAGAVDLAYRQAVAEAAAANPTLAAFYGERDYAPLWTSAADAGRREAFFRALAAAADHGLPASEYGADDLRARFAALASERQRGQLEVAVTNAFLDYAKDARTGVVDPARVDPGIVREVPKHDALATLRGFAEAEPRAFLRALPPQSREYEQLRRSMLDLRARIAQGGWGPTVAGTDTLRPGDSGARVVALRDRLIRMGYLRRTARQDYDGALQKAVQQFQIEHGLTPDGVVGAGTLAEINTAPEVRLRSVLVAMERMRWMNGVPLGQRHIWVNLPDFTAKVVDDGKVTFETPTIVGMNQDDRRSPEFSDQMEHMVVNPTWNVPRSITVKEYLPMLQKNPRAAGHLKITDRYGRVVSRETDFTQFTAQTFPFHMSQPPSDDNALGLVKFMFPNRWNIYLHDTPTKPLFQKEVRAFSHGCIRLGKPFDLAYTLLARQTSDPVAEFERYLRTGRETTVPLAQPIPVHLVYFTAWPTARGQVEFRRDVYGRDARIFDALAAAGVALPELRG